VFVDGAFESTATRGIPGAVNPVERRSSPLTASAAFFVVNKVHPSRITCVNSLVVLTPDCTAECMFRRRPSSPNQSRTRILGRLVVRRPLPDNKFLTMSLNSCCRVSRRFIAHTVPSLPRDNLAPCANGATCWANTRRCCCSRRDQLVKQSLPDCWCTGCPSVWMIKEWVSSLRPVAARCQPAAAVAAESAC